MTRGNQRDLARARNQKKQGEKNKAPEGKVTDRKERDAARMREKQKAAEEKKTQQAGASTSKK